MGLDLSLVKRSDYENDVYNNLAYGRKTWAIAYYFMNKSTMLEFDYLYNIPKEVYLEFVNEFKGKIWKMELALNIIDIYERAELYDAKIYRLAYAYIDRIMDKAFDGASYTLGMTWEADAVIRWVKAKKAILKAYDEGEVYMEVSY